MSRSSTDSGFRDPQVQRCVVLVFRCVLLVCGKQRSSPTSVDFCGVYVWDMSCSCWSTKMPKGGFEPDGMPPINRTLYGQSPDISRQAVRKASHLTPALSLVCP